MSSERISYLHVRKSDLAPGDEFFYVFGRKPNRDWDQARAIVLSVDGDRRIILVERCDTHTQHEIPYAGEKDVFGGPKLAAANADRSLVVKGGYGYLWVGQQATESL